ncbi:hypothetical protein KKF69_02450 [Patescibacteria group bacterium]|nr:hypothetical protein [Patescibacteria group bacterium]MBU4016319.1 hypothetical protein [Patescibacteria group bacterium]
MNKGINLLIDRHNAKVFDSVKNRLKILHFVAIGLLFIVGAFSVILSIFIYFSSLPKLRLEEQKARADLTFFQLDMNKLAFVNDRGNSIRKILDERTYYDKKLDIVRSKMRADVMFDDLLMTKTKYTLTFSSSNLISLDELLNGLASITGTGRDFVRVYMSSLSMDEKNRKFVLIVDLFSV